MRQFGVSVENVIASHNLQSYMFQLEEWPGFQTMSARQLAFERLGELRARRSPTAETPDRVQLYYERHRDKNTEGRLSQRHIDAFVGYCALNSEAVSHESVKDGLNTIISRWPAAALAIGEVQYSSNNLQHVSRVASKALLSTTADVGIPSDVHAFALELLSALKTWNSGKLPSMAKRSALTIATVTGPIPQLIALLGLLHAAAEKPSSFSFSQFITITRTLNEVLANLHKELPKQNGGTPEQLQHAHASSQYHIEQLQSRASNFVLRWCEYVSANSFSTTSADLWKTLANEEKFESEDSVVDNLVWETVLIHTQIQYDLSRDFGISTVGEAVLGQIIEAHTIACIALHLYEETLSSWITILLQDIDDLEDTSLGVSVIRSLGALAARFPENAHDTSKTLKDIIMYAPRSNDDTEPSLASLASSQLLQICERSSEDSVLGTITHFANLMNGNLEAEPSAVLPNDNHSDHSETGSMTSMSQYSERLACNAVEAVSVFGVMCRDSDISLFSLNVLFQKADRVSDSIKLRIMRELGKIALRCSGKDVLRVSDFYFDVEDQVHDREFSTIIGRARSELAAALVLRKSSVYVPYLEQLLLAGARQGRTAHHDFSSILGPLAVLLDRCPTSTFNSSDLREHFHNFWFGLVVAGYTVGSSVVERELAALKKIAQASPSLALETMTDSFEADLESYPLLKQSHPVDATRHLTGVLQNYVTSSTTRPRNFGEAVYLNALALLESLKSKSSVASGSLAYYRDSTMVESHVGGLLSAMFAQNTREYLLAVRDINGEISLGKGMRDLIVGCCDQIEAVRHQSALVIGQIIAVLPSAFCSSLAITTLLECITLLGWSCYEEYDDRYSPTFEFKSSRIDLCLTVSDSFAERRAILENVQQNARRWLARAMLESAADVRTLLTSYITTTEDHISGTSSDKGKLLAVEIAMKSSGQDQPIEQGTIKDSSDAFLGELTLRHLQVTSGLHLPPGLPNSGSRNGETYSLYQRSLKRRFIPFTELREKLCSLVARILRNEDNYCHMLQQLVEIPFNIFNIAAMRLATSLWARIAIDRPGLQANLLAEILKCWQKSLKQHRGMFSPSIDADNPFSRVMEYAPTDKEAIVKEGRAAKKLLEPHLNVLRFLSGRLSAAQSTSTESHKILLRILRITMTAMSTGAVSNHIFCRELRLRVLVMGMKLKAMLPYLGMHSADNRLSVVLYDAALSMFASSPRWAFGSDVGQLRGDRELIIHFLNAMREDPVPISSLLSSKTHLLAVLLEVEIQRINLWLDPMSLAQGRVPSINTTRLESYLAAAWHSNPSVAISLAQRFSSSSLQIAVRRRIIQKPWQCLRDPYAAEYVLGTSIPGDANQALKYLLYWSPVVPISATTYFLPAFKNNPLVLQYAMRSLESHPVEVTFFYVPQIVQVLRHDYLGYVRRFIVETAKLSQLFAHQIIWNFDANAYKDEDATMPDTIKPTLDVIKATMMNNLSGADKIFYETEFRFFGEVTSISGKLKPFIKRSKPEKKAKIDEEMALIKLEEGVYLPSNPDGEVIGIDRKSGRPLQSHAKAPFMATFFIRKSRELEAAFEDDLQVEGAENRQSMTQKADVIEQKLAAIFKVGDDCRQDVLALQLISTFRSIFNSIGLDLYVFPYRVTATAPGCGVIDVLPNSVSRDMLGREAVNGLYDYFITTFGKPETVAFQKARMNFVKSLAAYSVITYLLQFKDRHNGNIMYDSQGHVLHIDFGFCFDIAPGGITFESAPFKLTTEMIAVMGGSVETQSYKMFQELCIKAFLVARQYSEQIIHLVTLMLDSGLPCFKGQTTITNLRNRFHLEASEQQASKVMLQLIAQSHQNQRTVAYDMFQKLVSLYL